MLVPVSQTKAMFLQVMRNFFYYIFHKLHTHIRQADGLFKKNDSDVSPGCPHMKLRPENGSLRCPKY